MKKKEERTLKRKTLLKAGLGSNRAASEQKKEFPFTGNSFLYTM